MPTMSGAVVRVSLVLASFTLLRCSSSSNPDPMPALPVAASLPPVAASGAAADLQIVWQSEPLGGASIAASNTTLQFTSTIAGGTPPYSYRWSFGDGEESRDQHPVHTYYRPGAYTVAAWVTDARNVTAFTRRDLSVAAPPLRVNCTVTPTSGASPLDITGDAARDGCVGPCQFEWFDNGRSIGSERRLSHRVVESGLHEIKVVLTDAIGESGRAATCTRAVSVDARPVDVSAPGAFSNPPVVAGLSASPATVPIGGASIIQFSVTDPDGDLVMWSVNASGSGGGNVLGATSGTVPSGSAIAFFYAAGAPTGSVVLRIDASDGKGGSSSSSVAITVQ
jgi:hypothetical protein